MVFSSQESCPRSNTRWCVDGCSDVQRDLRHNVNARDSRQRFFFSNNRPPSSPLSPTRVTRDSWQRVGGPTIFFLLFSFFLNIEESQGHSRSSQTSSMILLVRSVQLLLLQGEITTDHYRATASQVSVIKNVTKRSVSHLSMLRKFLFFFCYPMRVIWVDLGIRFWILTSKTEEEECAMTCDLAWVSGIAQRSTRCWDRTVPWKAFGTCCPSRNLWKVCNPWSKKKNYPINEYQFFWKLFFGFLKKVENLAKIYDVLEVLNVHINEIYKKLNKLKF